MVMIVDPQNNAYVDGDISFDVMVEDVFLEDTMYNVDGMGWIDINTSFDTTGIDDGAYTVQIRARDEAGHEEIQTITVIVDNNAPEIGISSPVDDQFLEGMYTFLVMATDEVGVDEVRVTITNTDTTSIVIDDISIAYDSATGYYGYSLDTSSVADGNYTLSSIAYDLSGKDSGEETVNFKVDNTAPQLILTAPLNGAMLTGSVAIEVDFSDVFLVDMVYRVDGGAWVDLDTDWDTTEVNDGTHTIEIKLTDEAGHMTTQTVTVQTDNNGPDLYPVTLPVDDTHVGASFFIQMFARDTMGYVDVFYYIDDMESIRMFENKVTGFYEAEIVTDSSGLGLEDGDHTLTITATDGLNTPTEISRTIFVDNTGPAIIYEDPKDGDKINADWKFLITVTDDTGIDEVFIRIDKEEWLEMEEEDGKYAYTWNTRMVYNGEYDIDVKAIDTLGNENVESITVKVDNFPLIPFIIFIIVLVVLLVLMVINWTKGPKKKKPSKVEEAPTEPEIETEEEVPVELEESHEEINNLIDELENKDTVVSPEPPTKTEPSMEPQEETGESEKET
jgi:hypothetical protein